MRPIVSAHLPRRPVSRWFLVMLLGERALRHSVIWPELSFGTQSAAGNRFVERLLTVIETGRRQDRNVFVWPTERSPPIVRLGSKTTWQLESLCKMDSRPRTSAAVTSVQAVPSKCD